MVESMTIRLSNNPGALRRSHNLVDVGVARWGIRRLIAMPSAQLKLNLDDLEVANRYKSSEGSVVHFLHQS